jgi:hypothetical protein
MSEFKLQRLGLVMEPDAGISVPEVLLSLVLAPSNRALGISIHLRNRVTQRHQIAT